jgi:hypothetical protein
VEGSHEKTFDEIFSGEGGRLCLTGEPSAAWMGAFLDFERGYFDRSALPKVYVDLVNGQLLDAAVERRAGVFFVGIHSSCLAILSFLARGLMRSGKLYKGIGNPRAEGSEVLEWLNMLSGDLASFMPVIRETPFDEIEAKPQDRERARWSEHVLNCAWRLLVYHESAHVYFQHFDVIDQLDHTPRLREVLSFRDRHALSFQAIEMEADMFAAAALFADMSNSHGGDRVAIHAALSAMFWMSLLFEPNSLTFKDYQSRDHPHPALRFASMARAAMAEPEYVMHADPVVIRRWKEMANSVLADGLVAASTLGHSSAVLDWFEDLSQSKDSSIATMVEQNHRIRKEVMRLNELRRSFGAGGRESG